MKLYKETVVLFFQKLRESLNYETQSEAVEIRCNYNDTTEVTGLIGHFIAMENFYNQQNLQTTFYLGKLFARLKTTKSITKIIKEYRLNVSRQYIQEKISLYLVMFDFPRLQLCKISVNFLKSNKKLFLDEVRFHADCEFWRNKSMDCHDA